jgi:hypothetical protein
VKKAAGALVLLAAFSSLAANRDAPLDPPLFATVSHCSKSEKI